MRILQVISHYLPAHRFGGPLRVAHFLGQALVRQGHRVTVCCTDLADEQSDLDVRTDVPATIDGVRVFYSPIRVSRYWGYSPQLGRTQVIATLSALRCRKGKIDHAYREHIPFARPY